MALLDFLKRKKDNKKAAGKKPQVVLTKKEVSPVVRTTGPSKKEGKFSYEVVKDPHISEKGTILAESNKYVFKVYDRANKPQIKNSIEGIYGVNVLAVNIITVPHKKRRLGKTEGFKKGYKKALVTIKKGQKIEVF